MSVPLLLHYQHDWKTVSAIFVGWHAPKSDPQTKSKIYPKYGASSGTDDGTVRFWRLDTGASESFKAHENAVSALAACRDRRGELMLASAGFEGAIIMWTTHAKDGLKNNRVRKRTAFL